MNETSNAEVTNANIYLHHRLIGEIHTGVSGAYGMVQAQIKDEMKSVVQILFGLPVMVGNPNA